MPEQKEQKKQITSFLKGCLSAVEGSNEDIRNKGTSVRLGADYCNSVVSALKGYPEFQNYSDTEIKLALKQWFKGVILNKVAEQLGVIQE